jgi:hypothetical protein
VFIHGKKYLPLIERVELYFSISFFCKIYQVDLHVHVVDIDGNVDNHCLKFLLKMFQNNIIYLCVTNFLYCTRKSDILWSKESLNSDGQQFHQYQQYEQLPLTSNHWTQKKPQYVTLESHVPPWDKHKNVVGLNRLMGFQPSPLDNWISNGNISKQQRCLDVALIRRSKE